ncbi:MAG: HEAT repeat domain-containing protein [Agriterribacter sp.]
MYKVSHAILLFFFTSILFSSCKEKHYKEALSPEESMKTFQLVDGFGIELFAAEPLIKAPVSMTYDEKGIAYVVEMEDYPYKADSLKGKGVIKALFDNNNDGRIDSAVIFATGLPSATSMLPWKGGLIVTAAPDIVYLKDTTGDYKADIKEVLFTGFFADNSEAQITSLTLGVDNWIYANNHGQRGKIHSSIKPDAPAIDVSGGDFRFRLDNGAFENESGSGQFGMAMDDYGHRFYTQNTLHIQQAPIRWKYLHRNHFLPSDNADVNVSDHELVMFQKTPPPYWRAERSAQRQKDYDERKLDRKEYAEGHFTGSSGGTFYGGNAFPAGYYGSVFTGDVSGNLVHRDVLHAGVTSAAFVASRSDGEKDKEFLASTDPWFRPANFYSAPDGCLYIIDMYRQHIETPVSIPDELKKDMDFTNGNEYGRIYRVYPKDKSVKKQERIDVGSKTSAELVDLLASDNAWWRLQAQRLLLERKDSSVIPALKTMFATNTNPVARIKALFALEGLNALDVSLVQQALKDPQPGIREQAVILAEKYPALLPQLVAMVNDSSAQVVLQVALSLGEFKAPQVVPALATIIQQHVKDELFHKAVLSSEAGSSPELLTLLIREKTFFKEADKKNVSFIEDLCYVNGARQTQKDIKTIIQILSQPTGNMNEKYKLAALGGLAEGINRADNKEKPDQELVKLLEGYEKTAGDSIKSAIKELNTAITDTAGK